MTCQSFKDQPPINPPKPHPCSLLNSQVNAVQTLLIFLPVSAGKSTTTLFYSPFWTPFSGKTKIQTWMEVKILLDPSKPFEFTTQSYTRAMARATQSRNRAYIKQMSKKKEITAMWVVQGHVHAVVACWGADSVQSSSTYTQLHH